jgi:hypothetical protein
VDSRPERACKWFSRYSHGKGSFFKSSACKEMTSHGRFPAICMGQKTLEVVRSNDVFIALDYGNNLYHDLRALRNIIYNHPQGEYVVL